jgi:hypothetical protein
MWDFFGQKIAKPECTVVSGPGIFEMSIQSMDSDNAEFNW